MPEGHSVHRIARQFRANFMGERVAVSSPQGRFAQGAKLLDGREMTAARAVGKQMFLGFADDAWLRVHLGIYGAWDFAGDVRVDPSIEIHGVQGLAAAGRIGQTGEYGRAASVRPLDEAAEDSLFSIGAPRAARVRMAESEKAGAALSEFPPEPVGQVRARLLTSRVCADLRGPTACEVLSGDEMAQVVAKLGPDPANANTPAERERFITRAGKKRTPIGLVLMDQTVVAGIGNVYRAEMLFRAQLSPYRPANELPESVLGELWDDWAYLLDIGIRVGQMLTIDGLSGADYERALIDRDARHWVYKRDGEKCRRCGATILLEEMANRKLYWCPGCQH